MQKLNVRMPNWLGDAVMAVPALDHLKEAGYKLTLFGKPFLKTLLKDYPASVNTIENRMFSDIKYYRPYRKEDILLFPNSFESAFTVKVAGLNPYGYTTDMRRPILRHGIRKQKNFHEVEYYFKLAEFYIKEKSDKNKNSAISANTIITPDPQPGSLKIPVSQKSKNEAKKVLKDLNIKGPFLILSPYAVGFYKGKSKVWPFWKEFSEHLPKAWTDYMKETLSTDQKLSEEKDFTEEITLVTLPGPGEEKTAKTRLSSTVKTAPPLDLSTVMGIMSLSLGVVANDSGQMHIAVASAPEVFGIFGITNPVMTRPWKGHLIMGHNDWPGIRQVTEKIIETAAYNYTCKQHKE